MRRRMHRSTCFRLLLVALSTMLAHVSGCATMTLPTFKTEKSIKASAGNPVAQVVCMWQRAEGRGLDDLPSRGFAGQIVFLTAKSATPVEVEGDVTIYLFDDQAPIEKQGQPLHMARFVGGSWQTHLKTTTWGPTYQIFMPYIRKGAHRASCSLVVQIDTPDGRRVTSDMANIVLSGSETSAAGHTPLVTAHTREPAGRVHQAEPGDSTHVVQASAQSRLSTTGPAQDGANNQAPQFESFSIPYNIKRANARSR